MVTAQLNSFWNKAVGKTEARNRFNATLVRKSCVTKVHNSNPNLKNNLANLVCHSVKTASKTYYLQEKSKNASETRHKNYYYSTSSHVIIIVLLHDKRCFSV